MIDVKCSGFTVLVLACLCSVAGGAQQTSPDSTESNESRPFVIGAAVGAAVGAASGYGLALLGQHAFCEGPIQCAERPTRAIRSAVTGGIIVGALAGYATVWIWKTSRPAPQLRTDTADVLAAFWRELNRDGNSRNALRLFLPRDQDHGAVGVSERVRATLQRNGIPASPTLSSGDDTLVFRVTRWTAERSGAFLLDFRSESSTILGSEARPCRARSGSEGSYRVRRVNDAWVAQLVGLVMVGDEVCTPIPLRWSH